MITYPLSIDEQSSLYFQLQRFGAFCRGEDRGHFHKNSLEEILAIALEESRWDIRLLGILIDFFMKNFTQIRPFILKDYLMKNNSPEVIGVIKEYTHALSSSEDLKIFFSILTKDIKPQDGYKLYNLGQAFILKNIQHDVSTSLLQFKKWGFLCSEIPLLKETARTNKKLAMYSKEDRMRILRELLKTLHEISLNEYLQAISYSVTRQHARLDILSCKDIRQKGTTKGCVYFLKKYKHN